MIAAMRQNTWVDTIATFFAIIGRSVPSFRVRCRFAIVVWGDFPIFPIAWWNQGFVSSILPTL